MMASATLLHPILLQPIEPHKGVNLANFLAIFMSLFVLALSIG